MKNKRYVICVVFFLAVLPAVTGQSFYVQNWNYGIKVKSPVLETQYFQKEEKQNIGLCFVTDYFWKHFPCQVKLGNMNCGGLWSFVKSPELNFSTSAFFSAKSSLQNMSATLCTSNSFPEQLSCFVQLGYKNAKKTFSEANINCWYNPEKNTVTGAALIKFKLSKKFNGGISGVLGYVPYEENSYSAWFTNGAGYFPAGEMLCGAGEILLTTKCFSSLLISALYTTPEGCLKEVFRSENQLKTEHFQFSLSGFYNPCENLFLPDGSFLNPELSLQTGVIYKNRIKLSKPLIIKIGLNSHIKINLDNFEHPLKFAAGFQFSNFFTSTSLSFITGLVINKSNHDFGADFSSQKMSLNSKIYLTSVVLGLNTDFGINNYSSGMVFSHKYGFTVDAGNKIKCVSGINWGQSIKKGCVTSNELSGSMNLQWHSDWLYVTGKISIKYDL